MTPLMFGPAGRQVLGLFHAAEVGGKADSAILICPPFGQEAVRSHRLFRVLADRLARNGAAVLRFDYYGTGDSPGDDVEGEFDGWRRDICCAHEELRRLTGATRITWLGARLGATLATLAARSGRSDPARLILWDPIVEGPPYLQTLRERHVDALERSFCIPNRDWRKQLARDETAFADQALGFAISPVLRSQLQALRPSTLHLTTLHQTEVLASPDDDTVTRWCADEATRLMPVTLSPFKHPLVWTADPHPNNAMVPAQALQRLTSVLS